jgi:hypothetical protein
MSSDLPAIVELFLFRMESPKHSIICSNTLSIVVIKDAQEILTNVLVITGG